MQIKCDYCGHYFDDHNENCPFCGSKNEQLALEVTLVPKTIQELEEWYIARKLPPYDVTRFFIGINTMEPKVFGIYKDYSTGDFVVYKNKDTGDRAIRYCGPDEAYAVNELFLKLKEEILKQKNINNGETRVIVREKTPLHVKIARTLSIILCIAIAMYVFSQGSFYLLGFALVFFIGLVAIALLNSLLDGKLTKFNIPFVVALLIGAMFFGNFTRDSYGPKYYKVNNKIYCEYNDDWYYWSDTMDNYIHTPNIPSEIDTNKDAYVWDMGNSWNSSVDRFERSEYYQDNFVSNSDSFYDWDSGSSWDSGGSDWSSDW